MVRFSEQSEHGKHDFVTTSYRRHPLKSATHLRVHSPNNVYTSTEKVAMFDVLSCGFAGMPTFEIFNFYWQVAPLLGVKLTQ